MTRRLALPPLLLGAALCALPATAQFTQDRTGFAPGETDPVDSILARRVTMAAINRMNDDIHDYIDENVPYDDHAVRLRLDNISTMLLSFPEMFPKASSIHAEDAGAAEDPASVSLALPAVWETWDDFYSRALTSSDTAYRAGRANTREELVRLTLDLEQQCESCHQAYREDAEYTTPESLGLVPPSP